MCGGWKLLTGSFSSIFTQPLQSQLSECVWGEGEAVLYPHLYHRLCLIHLLWWSPLCSGRRSFVINTLRFIWPFVRGASRLYIYVLLCCVYNSIKVPFGCQTEMSAYLEALDKMLLTQTSWPLHTVLRSLPAAGHQHQSPLYVTITILMLFYYFGLSQRSTILHPFPT